ncbi:hypothetical protein YPPY13_1588 [Yersinia pestis PY-13]|uniref:Uncharacterized protein n=3 Tax=Yersinia pseudotuberculosis complex TaxID=1649845 RepID=A0A0U1R2J1_YERP3|nr:hypothetical protein YpsIP31758_2673 [Yersinia pseudotuberculosis IP 31758]ABX87950.1 hypothetical protein YpAngola_A1534 [Yersinia pestis Angola]EDR34445.1 hypothetical protein YPIP275_4740 [Yersinia pestis biovar Orientalis str. IP275]EDR43477.1 hypothetical protein YpE1979001_2563 [Yersinia pestis biovar Antiqua str. E1979001]EDR52015.1 hypothetical protein YpB42003004_2328 [Yersinia pestis biovar Antiqua str. B42003004]EDR58508.1 hypothetical protein YpMG051020_0618 [Yersinia pestis bio
MLRAGLYFERCQISANSVSDRRGSITNDSGIWIFAMKKTSHEIAVVGDMKL